MGSAIAEVLEGAAATAGEATVVRAPRKPSAAQVTKARTRNASTATAAGRRANSEARQNGKAKVASVPRPKVDPVKQLPEAIGKVLAKANAAQVKRALSILAFDPKAVFSRPDKDGDIVVRYVPGWEQGRMKAGVFVKGPSRLFVYLIDKGGELSGHGYKYRSTSAEAKLKPLEEKNAARLAREAKKAA